MDRPFQIFLDRLKNEHVEKIEGTFPPTLFDEEKDLQFPFPIEMKIDAYLSQDQLVIHMSGKTRIRLRCSICNSFFEKSLGFSDFYHIEPLAKIPHAVYDFTENVREAFLIELPQFGECHGGKCPEREKILPYVKNKKDVSDDTYYPFSNL